MLLVTACVISNVTNWPKYDHSTERFCGERCTLARLEPEPAKMQMSEPESVLRSTGSTEPVLLTNGHHKEQVARAESEEPVETDIPLEVIIVVC